MRVSVAGVALGGVVDLVTSNALSLMALGLWLTLGQAGASVGHGAASPADFASALQDQPVMAAIRWGAGSLGAVAGGYMAARIAGRAEVLNGALAAWAGIALGLLPVLQHGHLSTSPALFAAEAAVSIAASALGGWLSLREILRPI